MVRLVLAGVLGGLLMFVAGAIEHMMFGWGDRAMKSLPNDKAFREFLGTQNVSHAIYTFPRPENIAQLQFEQLNEIYKRGPSGLLIIGPTGEDMMSPKTLGLEAGSNVLVALIAAFIVSRLRVGSSFGMRWLTVVLIGLAAWLSISVSHGIWYKFHWDYIRDELFCALLESALAGLVVAALARPQPELNTAPAK